MKRILLAFAALTLAVVPTSSAFADTFDFSFTGPIYSGSGVLTTTAGTPGAFGSTEYDVTSITGSVGVLAITGLSNFDGADNEVFDPGIFGIYNLDTGGLSFVLSDGIKVNLSASTFTYLAEGSTRFSTEPIDFDLDKVRSTSAVPEPSSIALLGTGILAAAGAVRRRFIA